MGGNRPMRGYMTEEQKKNSPKITKELILRIFRQLLPYRFQALLLFAVIILTAILELLPSLFSGRIIDEGFLAGDFQVLACLVGASFAAYIASGLIGILKNYLSCRIAMSIIMDMWNQMYAHLQKMSQRFFAGNRQGDIFTRMTSDIDGIKTVVVNTVTDTLSNTAVLTASIIALYQKNWILASIGITIVPLLIIPTRLVGKKRWTLTLQTQEKQDKLNQITSETLSVSGQQLVKLFTNEEIEYREYSEANREMCRLSIRSSMAGRWHRMALGTFTNMGPLLIYLVGGYLILKQNAQRLTVGDITVMVTLLTKMYRPVQSLLDVHVELIRATALFKRIFDYFDMPIEIESKADAIIPDHRPEGTIAYKNVYFGYSAENQILKNVSFEIPAGKTYAVVGPSGAGKSTLVNFLVRLYDVTGGSVELDGNDVRDLDLRYLRQNVGMVTQDNYLFNGTILDNLRYAKHHALHTGDCQESFR